MSTETAERYSGGRLRYNGSGLFGVLVVAVALLSGTMEVEATPEQAAAEAQLGIEQYRAKQYDAAYGHLARAAELDPANEDYQVDAAILSEIAGGAPVRAIPYYHRAARLATKRKDYDAIRVYNLKVSKLAEVMPEWVEQKVAEIKGGKEEGDDVWRKGRDQLKAFIQQKKYDQAVSEGERLLALSREQLGAAHPLTLKSWGQLAVAMFHSDQVEAGLNQLKLAEAEAVAAYGPQHPETQRLQMLLGELYHDHDQPQVAADYYAKAAKEYGESIGVGHPDALEAAYRLSRVEELRGDYLSASQALLLSCVGAARTLGNYHLQAGECYQRLGLMNMRHGDNIKAQSALNKSEGILRKVVGKRDPAWIQTQIYRADLARSSADFASAEEILVAIAEGEEVTARLKYEAKGVLAQLFEDQGLYPKAEAETVSILEYENGALGELHPNAITTLNNLAGLQRKQSRLIEAEKGYELALQRFTEVMGKDHPSTLAVMNNLALTLETQGLYDRAEPLYRRSLKMSKEVLGEVHPTTIANMNNLALLYESQGTFEKAEPLYQQTIELLVGERGEVHPDTIAVKNNLGYLYLLQQRNEDAVELFDEVVAEWEQSLGERHQKYMKGLNNLGRVNHNLGELESAEELISRALQLRTEVLGENHMDTLRSQHDLGKLYMDMERYEESLELLLKTREQAEQNLGEQHPYTFETLNTLAQLQERMEDIEGAFTTQQTLFERRNIFLDQMLWATSENAREGYIRLHRPELYRLLNMVSVMEPAEAGRELARISLYRKGLLLHVASQIHQVTKMADDPALTAISDELMNTRKELAALTLSGPTEETAVSFLEKQSTLKERISELEGELGRASTRFREAAEEINLATLEANLPEGAALVDFMAFRDGENNSQLQVAIMKNEGGEIGYDHYLYEDIEAINDAVAIIREVIQDEYVGEDELIDVGIETYDMIWAPIAEKLGEVGEVYVVPDGMLNILPFNAMVTEDEEYLLAALDIHSISSSRDLIPSSIPVAAGGYMIMAGPDYDTDEVTGKSVLASLNGKRSAAAANQAMRGMAHGMRGLSFAPLPGAEEEGRQIKEQIGESGSDTLASLIQRKEAQEELLRKIEPPTVLHISTHGFFLKPNEELKKRLSKLTRGADLQIPPPGDNPLMRAGLAFAGLNANAKLLGEIDTDNDGVLTALEVLGLNLTGTRLAILSACETGLGEVHEGEGVYGLRRSFQEAGAGAVVNSLWEVSDAGTQALMNGLYQRILEGEDVHSALRNTQLDMSQSDEWAHPYIWSAFFMVEGAVRSDS